jgi:Domain of unknown function (DUF4157)
LKALAAQQSANNLAQNAIIRKSWAIASIFSPSSSIQRKPKCACGGDCPRCQSNKTQSTPSQSKLIISEPGDRTEQEADRIAHSVMQQPNPSMRPQIGAKPKQHQYQRQPSGDRSGSALAPQPPSAIPTPGQGLPEPVRHSMETRFGQDFSQVRMHTSPQAAQAAAALHARAFTLGSDIVFGANEFQPQTSSGQLLLAHELVHYLQQRSSSGPQTAMRVAVEDCDEVAGQSGDNVLVRHFQAQRLLKQAIALTAQRNARGERLPSVKAALLEWFKIDLDSTLSFENAQHLRHVENALKTTLAGSENVSYECDQGGFLDVCNSDRNANTIGSSIHLCSGWWSEPKDRQAIILIHEWSHKYGEGISRLFETYCWEDDFADLSSSDRIRMPDAYEGYISKLTLGTGTC